MKNLTRELLLKPFGVEPLEIKELDGTVYVKRMSVIERSEFLKSLIKIEGDDVKPDYEKTFENMALLVQLTVCDETGKRLFEKKDTETIKGMDGLTLDRIYRKSIHINGLSADAVKEAAKNS